MLRRSEKAIFVNINDDEKRIISIVLTIIDFSFQTYNYKLFDFLYIKKEKVTITQIADWCYVSRNKAFHDIDAMNQIIKTTLKVIREDNLNISFL